MWRPWTGFVEEMTLVELPGAKSDAMQMGRGKVVGEAAQCCTEAAANIEDSRMIVRELHAFEDFEVHLLKHDLAVEGIHAAAEESEMHVETWAPGCVIGAGLLVVALKAVCRYVRCRRCCCERDWH